MIKNEWKNYNTLNLLHDIEIIQEHRNVLGHKKKEHLEPVNDSYTSICGFHVSMKYLLENEDIRKQISSFIAKEVVMMECSDFSDQKTMNEIESNKFSEVQIFEDQLAPIEEITFLDSFTYFNSEENVINTSSNLSITSNKNRNHSMEQNNKQINNTIQLDEIVIENLQNACSTDDVQILNIIEYSGKSTGLNKIVEITSKNGNDYENLSSSDNLNIIKVSNDKEVEIIKDTETTDDLCLFGSDDWYYLNIASNSNVNDVENYSVYEEDELNDFILKEKVETKQAEIDKNKDQRGNIKANIKEKVKNVKKKIKKLQAEIIKKKKELQENRVLEKKRKLQGKIVKRSTKPVTNVSNEINTTDILFENLLNIQSPSAVQNINIVSNENGSVEKKVKLQGKIVRRNPKVVETNVQMVINTTNLCEESLNIQSPSFIENVNSASFKAVTANLNENKIVKKKRTLQGKIVKRNIKPVATHLQNVINTANLMYNSSNIQPPSTVKNVNSISSCKLLDSKFNENKIREDKVKGTIIKRNTKAIDTNVQSVINATNNCKESLNLYSPSLADSDNSVSSFKGFCTNTEDIEQNSLNSFDSLFYNIGNLIVGNVNEVTKLSDMNTNDVKSKSTDSVNSYYKNVSNEKDPEIFIQNNQIKNSLPLLKAVRKVRCRGEMKCAKRGRKRKRINNMKQHKIYKGLLREEYGSGDGSTKINSKYFFENSLRSQKWVKAFPSFLTEDEKEIWKYFKSCCIGCSRESSALQQKTKCRLCKGNLVYLCGMCNKTYRTYVGLRIHILLNLNITPNETCCKCGRGNFMSLCKLRNHELLCNLRITTMCTRIPYVRLVRCDSNMNVFQVGPSYILQSRCWTCLITGIAFEKMKRCKECNTLLLFKCEICNKLETTYSSLCNHVLHVHSIQPHQCTVCGIVFDREQLLQQHIKSCDSRDI